MENKRTTTRNRDPFAVDPLPKAYYFPSPERPLNKATRATAIKTNYSTEAKTDGQSKNEELSPFDEMFLKGSNMFQTKPTATEDTEADVNFDETWPSSERPSSHSFTSLDDETHANLDKYMSYMDKYKDINNIDEREEDHIERRRMPGSTAQGTGVTASSKTGMVSRSRIPVPNDRPGSVKRQEEEENNADSSVLQRYINRFRNSQPMSREEREKSNQSGGQDFWWLSKGPPPERKANKKSDDASATHTTPLTTVNLDKYKHLQELAQKQKSQAYIPESPGDKRTIDLQERAEKLLERSSSTVLSTEPAVSTEGLGSNVSDMSSLEEYTYRPKFAEYLDFDLKARYQKSSQPPLLGQEPQGQRAGYQSLAPPPLPGQRPPAEDDPLHQWRLRRRMELAQQAAPQHAQQFDFINKSGQQKKIDQKLEDFKQKLSGRAPAQQRVQFTPAPQPSQPQQQQQYQTCQNIPQTGDGRYQEPQIASPSLHPPKPRSNPVEQIDPHLHLMCDLLPCPHKGVFQNFNNQETSADVGTKNRYHENLEEKNVPISNQDISSDKMGKYKQYLEAEKPDVDIPHVEKNTTGEERGQSEESGKKDIHDIEAMVRDIGRTDEDNDDVYRSDSKGDDKNISRKSNVNGQKEIEKESKLTGSISDRSDTKAKHLEIKVTSYKRLDDTEEEQKERVIKPKHSSSPKNGRKGVNAAIGQAVKEHLFSTSISTVLSSVDSLPPSASTDRLPWQQKPPSHVLSHDQQTRLKPPSHDQQAKQTEENGMPYESDEEFAEDNLLQMLRKQRDMFERQLQEIDNQLNKLESR